MAVVNDIKRQYARILCASDAGLFKAIAEYYFGAASRLKKRHISTNKDFRLLVRNSKKRLYLGIGVELLVKSYYLEHGYCVNKFRHSFALPKVPTHKLASLKKQDINPNDTFTLGPLIDNLEKIAVFQDINTIRRGFEIAMTFRNKEGHTSFPAHEFDESNYRDIENAVTLFYKYGFSEDLEFHISMKANEKALFEVGGRAKHEAYV